MAQYNFSNISPHDFEVLTRDLLQARDGTNYESFSPGRDKGIDLRHISPDGSRHIVQCKHWAGSGYSALLSHLKNEEKGKVDRLAPERYSVITSVPLTPGRKDEIVDAMAPHIRSPDDVLGPEDINNLIERHPVVERSHFKLWLTSTSILETILHNEIVVFTEGAIEDIQRKCSLYVQNDGFEGARKVLKERHCCIIAGAPGIGKTMLADMLLLYYMAEGFEPVLVSEKISEADAVYGKEKKQVFYYDDFLGQTALAEKLAKNEDARLLDFIRRVEVNDSKRFIMTTREYILRQAQRAYEPLARADSALPRYVLELKDYTKRNRAEILYNHVWFSALSQECRIALIENEHYLKVIDHPNYNPRLIEAIIQQASQNSVSPDEFRRFSIASLDNPATVWSHAFDNQLDHASRAILRALLLASGNGERVEVVTEQAIAIAHADGRTIHPANCQQGLRDMEDTFIRIGRDTVGGPVVRYHNPSIRDFMLSRLEADPGSMSSLLAAFSSTAHAIVISGYSSASNDDDDPRHLTPKYPKLRSWLQDNVSRLGDALASALGLSAGRAWVLPASLEEKEFRHGLQALWRIESSFRPEWLADIVSQLDVRWRVPAGERLEAAKLVQAIDHADAVPAKLIESLDAALRSWELPSFDELEAFTQLIEMEAARPGSVTDEEVKQAEMEAEAFIEAEVEHLIYNGDSEIASGAIADLRSVAERFELSEYAVDRLEEAVREMGDSDEDYEPDFERERGGSAADANSDIRELFGSLTDP